MKEYALTTFKYLFLALFLVGCTMAENAPFLLLRVSFVVCLCLCMLRPEAASVAICASCGFLADVYCVSLPCFSLLYLYISAGCVWSVKLFVSIRGKTVFIISFLALLVFCAGEFFVNLLIFESFSLTPGSVLMWILFSVTNASFSPIIYCFLKRAGY